MWVGCIIFKSFAVRYRTVEMLNIVAGMIQCKKNIFSGLKKVWRVVSLEFSSKNFVGTRCFSSHMADIWVTLVNSSAMWFVWVPAPWRFSRLEFAFFQIYITIFAADVILKSVKKEALALIMPVLSWIYTFAGWERSWVYLMLAMTASIKLSQVVLHEENRNE